jgi:putative transcriptional regulator
MLEVPTRLAPGLLLALPQLRDPNFHRSVVVLTSHADDGAMGFVVNRPLPATVPEVLDGLNVRWAGDPGEPVWAGGPVGQQSGFVLYDRLPGGEQDPQAEEVVPGLWLSASLDTLRRLGSKPPAHFRLMLGYAGWSPGQLENEVLEGAWTAAPLDPPSLFATPAEELWARSFRRLGIDPASIVPSEGIQ